jgi:hypothetical protein
MIKQKTPNEMVRESFSPKELASDGVELHSFCIQEPTHTQKKLNKNKTIEIHLNNFQRKRMTWKPHYHNSTTWAFF